MARFVSAAAIAAVTLGLGASYSEAEPPPVSSDVEMELTPKKAGTKAHPKGVRLGGLLRFGVPGEGVPAVVLTGGRLLIPRGLRLDGDRYVACKRRLFFPDVEWADECPARSYMGTGTNLSINPVSYAPHIDFINGGSDTIWAFTTYYNPALVQEPFRIKVRHLKGRSWSHELSFRIPEVLQMIGRIPITVPDAFKWKLGGRPYAPKYLVSDRGCPKRGYFKYRGNLAFRHIDGARSVTRYRGRLACR